MKEIIYKQDALDAINRCRDDYDLSRQEQIDDCENAVRELLPAERTGHWIVETDCEGKTRTVICEDCGYESSPYQWENPNFCPDCGRRMIEKDGETE